MRNHRRKRRMTEAHNADSSAIKSGDTPLVEAPSSWEYPQHEKAELESPREQRVELDGSQSPVEAGGMYSRAAEGHR